MCQEATIYYCDLSEIFIAHTTLSLLEMQSGAVVADERAWDFGGSNK